MIDIDIDIVTFKELSLGDMFLYRDNIYMTTAYIKASNMDNEEINCINLNNGFFNYLTDDTKIIPLEAHLKCALAAGGTYKPKTPAIRPICDCYEKPISGYGEGRCNGTAERDYCSCKGNTRKCDFYPEVRENGR